MTTPNGYGSCSISPRPVDELNRLYSWGHRNAKQSREGNASRSLTRNRSFSVRRNTGR